MTRGNTLKGMTTIKKTDYDSGLKNSTKEKKNAMEIKGNKTDGNEELANLKIKYTNHSGGRIK